MKRIMAIILVTLSILLLSGCWDRIELEEIGYVVVIGIDKGKEEGRISITLQVENPQVGTTDIAQAENEPASLFLTFEAPDVLSAQHTAVATLSRRLTYSHAEAIVIGEEFARSENCFELIGDLMRNREIRATTNFIVSRERASDFIRKNKPDMETRIHKFYMLVSGRWEDTGFITKSDLRRYIQRTEQDEGLYTAIYGTAMRSDEEKYGDLDEYLPGQIDMEGGNPVQFIGAALFKEGRMIGSLTGEETRIVTMFRGDYDMREMKATFQDPIDSKYRVTTNLKRNGDPKVKINVKGDRPHIDIGISLDVHIINIPSHVSYVEDLEKQKLLKASIKEKLEEISKKLVEKTQNEFEADPFLWGLKARREFYRYDDYRNYDWMKHYPEAEVNVTFDINHLYFGKGLNPVPIEKVKDR